MLFKNKKILLLITSRNTQETIVDVLNDIKSENLTILDEILVIDNKSSDNTILNIKTLLKKRKDISQILNIIRNETNLGYGGSIKKGFDYSLKNNFDYLIIHHSDNQTSTNDLITNLKNCALSYSDFDIILTSRFLHKNSLDNYSLLRKFGNKYFNFITKLLTSYNLSDPGAALSLINCNFLKKIPYQYINDGYHFHPELNLLYFKNNAKIHETPMRWSDSIVQSEIKLFSYGLKLMSILLIYFFQKTFKLSR